MTRFLLYSHDTYGLGHFRRSALIASGLVGADQDNEVLIVTGSPKAEAFRLPERIDTIKLPTATKDSTGCYQPRRLGGAIEQLVSLRAGLVRSAVEAYEPDVVLVDHSPLGMEGELVPMFESVDRLSHRPRMVLGLRDIIDDANRVDAAWHRDGIWEALDHYDDILVYGDPQVLSTATEIGLDRRCAATVTHTGYVAPRMPEPLSEQPFLLVTPGGGGDGQQLLRTFLNAAEAGVTSGLRCVVVTGPLLSAGRRAELLVRAERIPSVEVIQFSDRMRSLIASAVGVISMAGYNTVVEELAAGTPSLLVPRCEPRLEQHIRASRLAPWSNLQHCPLDALDSDRIRAFINACGQRPRQATNVGLDLGGVHATVSTLCADRTPRRNSTHA